MFARLFLPLALLAASTARAEHPVRLPADLPGAWTYYGRGEVKEAGRGVVLHEGFAVAGQTLRDCSVTVNARAASGAAEVQIWAGLRCRDREHRYVFALRGGSDPEVFLARQAPDGAARFLGFAPLEKSPVVGEWQQLRAVAVGDRFLVFVGDETLPRINVRDPDAPWREGGACLGGGWLPVEFRRIDAHELTTDERRRFTALGDATWQPPAPDREAERARQRAAFAPLAVPALTQPRADIPLDGRWLFQPTQNLRPAEHPAAPDDDDTLWHVVDVPNFWGPVLPWLYGEESFKTLRGLSRSKGIADGLLAAETARADAQTFDWRATREAWYRRPLDLPANVAGRHAELCFDAIAKVSEVWFNGTRVASHRGMFGEVRADISSLLHPGRNVVAVHILPPVGETLLADADKKEGVAVTVEVTKAMLNSLPHGMYPSSPATSGIWQPARLEITDAAAVTDVFVRPRLDGGDFDLAVRNDTPGPVTLRARITGPDGELHRFPDRPVPPGKTTLTLSAAGLAPKLWTPATPNLYRLETTLLAAGRTLDERAETFGFRTFTVAGGRLLLNGQPYWLRGGNLLPNVIRPNDPALARAALAFAKSGNVAVTRSHAVPFTETWLRAADETGMGVSIEGTWPWLMLKGEPPDPALLALWKDEWASLMRKARNHPCVLFWTVNNEMKFPVFDKKDAPLLRRKWTVLDDAIRAMRATDPTRPVVADSSYVRAEAPISYDQVVAPNHFDDGDIDDVHRYYGWYNRSFFHFNHGELGAALATPGRPLISQEMSTGYPRNDGHPVRSYLYAHLTPQTLVGDFAYENADPALFLTRQAFVTKELAETIRRADRTDLSGVLHFCFMSWVQNAWDPAQMHPFPAADALRLALQPVLVSAQLPGRHWYAGTAHRLPVCLANDSDDARPLPAARLTWEIRAAGQLLSTGTADTPAVPYYENRWLTVNFTVPAALPAPRTDAELLLRLEADGRALSENRYDLVLATREWAARLASLPPNVKISPRLTPELLDFARNGGRVLLLHPGASLDGQLPGVGRYRSSDGDIANARVPEHPAFDGLAPLDLAWFEPSPNAPMPHACWGSHGIVADAPGVTVLATHYDFHAYLEKPEDIAKYGGAALVEARVGKGRILISEMALENPEADPVAGRLLANLLADLARP